MAAEVNEPCALVTNQELQGISFAQSRNGTISFMEKRYALIKALKMQNQTLFKPLRITSICGSRGGNDILSDQDGGIGDLMARIDQNM